MMITYEVSAEEVLRLFRSDVTFGLHVDGTLEGFARVLSDEVYLALILDVIVSPSRRGEGLGAALMEAIVNHPKVSGARSVELVCQPDLVPFYSRWGFTDRVGRSRLMRRTTDPTLIS